MLAGHSVRWLTTKQGRGGPIAPFESQWTSATQRHRNARQKQLQPLAAATTPMETGINDVSVVSGNNYRRPVLDAVVGVSKEHSKSATVLHRMNRTTVDIDSRGGSAVALMSATNRHRLNRQSLSRPSPSHIVNPSNISFPLDSLPKGFERLRIIEKGIHDEATILHVPPARSTFRPPIGLIITVVGAAVVGYIKYNSDPSIKEKSLQSDSY